MQKAIASGCAVLLGMGIAAVSFPVFIYCAVLFSRLARIDRANGWLFGLLFWFIFWMGIPFLFVGLKNRKRKQAEERRGFEIAVDPENRKGDIQDYR